MMWLIDVVLLVASAAAIAYGAFGEHTGGLGMIGVAWVMVGVYGIGAWTAVTLMLIGKALGW